MVYALSHRFAVGVAYFKSEAIASTETPRRHVAFWCWLFVSVSCRKRGVGKSPEIPRRNRQLWDLLRYCMCRAVAPVCNRWFAELVLTRGVLALRGAVVVPQPQRGRGTRRAMVSPCNRVSAPVC